MSDISQNIFISHATKDDPFVRHLQQKLADLRLPGWIDSRELRGGDSLESEIFAAIEAASAYMVVISVDSLRSEWVYKELAYALKIRKQREDENFRIVPLALDGVQLGRFGELFGEEPLYIPVSCEAGGLEKSLPAILAALGLASDYDISSLPLPIPTPLEDWILVLDEPGFEEIDGTLRPKATARLFHQPVTDCSLQPVTTQNWTFLSPLGAAETKEINWYLEQYPIWPGKAFKLRAVALERQLLSWGESLYAAALPSVCVGKAFFQHAATTTNGMFERRFSVQVNLDESKATQPEARLAATMLLSLPWELLQEDGRFLFDGGNPIGVRRRLSRSFFAKLPVARLPIRILLITSRPEAQDCTYIDHRSSAKPLVEATEMLGDILQFTQLKPPTFSALQEELIRARQAGQPYHVIHFDGNGGYYPQAGKGGFCFEDPRDQLKLTKRRYQIIYADQLAAALRNHNIALVFLDVCQTAQAEMAAGSLASELLLNGVPSIVAMNYAALVKTSSRFVEVFYRKLAAGARIGEAVLAGRCALYVDTFRAQIFGADELRLKDWFVPVLFQEQDDPRLFEYERLPSIKTKEVIKELHRASLRNLPPDPATGFIGRSRELLALERVLYDRDDRHVVICGNGGEGKTTLVVELARWLVRTKRVKGVAFVSLEQDGNAAAVLNALLEQLVTSSSSIVATPDQTEPAYLEIERVLRERPSLLVLDNLESLLSVPGVDDNGDNLTITRAKLKPILTLCQRFNNIGETRIIFTTRIAITDPLQSYPLSRNNIQLDRLTREDAICLIREMLYNPAGLPDSELEAVERLIDSLQCHARTLALLADSIQKLGLDGTRETLEHLMAELHRRLPYSRELSLYASVELSLRRLPPKKREQVFVLSVFHGGVDLDVLSEMMDWSQKQVLELGEDLATIGLATVMPNNFLRLDPALAPYLRSLMEPQSLEKLKQRWAKSMQIWVEALYQRHVSERGIVNKIIERGLPNFLCLLEHLDKANESEATIQMCTRLSMLTEFLGKSYLEEQICRFQEKAFACLPDGWSHIHFEAQYMRIDAYTNANQLGEATKLAKALYEKAVRNGVSAYSIAEYDIAIVAALVGRMYYRQGKHDEAMKLLEEARNRFQSFASNVNSKNITVNHENLFEGIANSLMIQGNILYDQGKYSEAEKVFREAISVCENSSLAEKTEHIRMYLAKVLSKQNIGNEVLKRSNKNLFDEPVDSAEGLIRLKQAYYDDVQHVEEVRTERLKMFEEARDRLTQTGEPSYVVEAWYELGCSLLNSRLYDETEQCFRKALYISVRSHFPTGHILHELSNLYCAQERWEEAKEVLEQSVREYEKNNDTGNHGLALSNLARTVYKLGDYSSARKHALNALELTKSFGDAATPWKAWSVLKEIEVADHCLPEAEFARLKAIESYLAFRRRGGENESDGAMICNLAERMIKDGKIDGLLILLQNLRKNANWQAQGLPMLDTLEAIAIGNRAPTLADNPTLSCYQAVEIILLLEKLQRKVMLKPSRKGFFSSLISKIFGKQDSVIFRPPAGTQIQSIRAFQQREILIPVPPRWILREEQKEYLPVSVVTITHSSNEVMLMASFFPDTTGKMVSRKACEKLLQEDWEKNPKGGRKIALEKNPNIRFCKTPDGMAAWYSLTDSTLVGRDIPPNQWLYVTSAIRSWKGAFAHFTILSNSLDSEEYHLAKDLALSGIMENYNTSTTHK